MPKKSYPGGFRLTLKTARALAIQQFGTAKGLEVDTATSHEGHFRMRVGNLFISIHPDIGMSGCIEVIVSMCTANHRCVGYFNRETLEPDYAAMDKYEQQEKREALEQWVFGGDTGPLRKVYVFRREMQVRDRGSFVIIYSVYVCHRSALSALAYSREGEKRWDYLTQTVPAH